MWRWAERLRTMEVYGRCELRNARQMWLRLAVRDIASWMREDCEDARSVRQASDS